MLTFRFARLMFLVVGALGAVDVARAQSDEELKALNQQTTALYYAGKYAEAIPLAERYEKWMKARYGNDHPQYAVAIGELAELLRVANRLAEAEPLMRSALVIEEGSFGSDHPKVATSLNNLGVLLIMANRLIEAEPLLRRAVAIDEKAFGPDHFKVARDLSNLAMLLKNSNRIAEAELLMRRGLEITEKRRGPNDRYVSVSLGNLAELLQISNRPTEAEPLLRRALAIDEEVLGPEHPAVAVSLNNLASLLYSTNRLIEAELLYQRSLVINEKTFGPEHPIVATGLNNLASLLERLYGRYEDAERLKRQALAINEKNFGPAHPEVAHNLHNLAFSLFSNKRLGEAEPLMRRALAISEQSFGRNHPSFARSLNGLAILRAGLGDWVEAASLHARAKPIMTAARREGQNGDGALAANTRELRAAARAVYRADSISAEARGEGFELAQWALQTGAADALAQMSVRFAKGPGQLAQMVRERQDLIARRHGEDKRLLSAVGAADAKVADAIRSVIGGLDAKVDAIDKRLGNEFPDYASLARPKPLTIAATQALLKPDEALVVFLDVPRFGTLPEETLAWGLTKTEARWVSIPLGTAALAERVAALRCGLDASNWQGTLGWPEHTASDNLRIAEQRARREHCEKLLGVEPSANELPPFDLAVAYELCRELFAPLADLTTGKRLMVVPSGPLTSLPFHVLVTRLPPVGSAASAQVEQRGREIAKPADYSHAAWLALEQSITVLPSVGSLQALRKLGPSAAREPYIAFGNPLLDGGPGDRKRAEEARAKQKCPQSFETLRHRASRRSRASPGLACSRAAARSTSRSYVRKCHYRRLQTNCAPWQRRLMRWAARRTLCGLGGERARRT